jgi:RHS repeat-associated protein
MKKHLLAAVLISFALWPQPASAKYIGPDPPKGCPSCGCNCTGAPSRSVASDTSTSVSATEGNLTERVPISSVFSTLGLSLVYNSYNADGSRAMVDTVMGYGWTHSYNIFLFSQAGLTFRYDGDGRVTRYGLGPGGTYIAATGYFETLTAGGGGFNITQKDQTVYHFALIPGTPFLVGGPVYRLTSIVDRNGNTTTLTYASGNLTKVTDTYGRAITFTYTAQNKVASVTDPAGRVTTFQYDSTGHKLTQITDPLGKAIKYTYNFFYQPTSKTDKAGRTFTYSYASGFPGLPIAVKDGAGSTSATLSNPSNWATDPTQLAFFVKRVYTPSTTTNADGRANAWKYQYDANAYLTQTVAPDGATTKYTYDSSTLQVATVTDANGHATTYKYDAEGNRTQTTDALGHVTTYTYEPVFNMMTSMTDPRGRTTTYAYDVHGNRVQETDPLGQTHSWTYDSNGNVLTETDKDGHTTTYQYDAFGDRVKSTDPLGNITTMTYDPVGNMLTRTDADSHTASYQYDGLNRLTQVTDPTGHTDQTSYDGEGNRVQTIDRNGHTTSYQYDVRQRLTKMTDALNQNETYTYDGNDNRVSSTDRDGHTTTYGYDLDNRQNKVTDALGDVTTTAYDLVGNVVSQTDANGHTTTNTYDALNRRSSMTDAVGEQTQYFYDTGTFIGPVDGINCTQCGATPGSSLVTEQIDPDGTAGSHAGVIYYKYDALDRLVIRDQKTGCIGAGCPDTITGTDAVTAYTYDPVGNRQTLTEPDGNTTTSVYDADNRVTHVTNAAGDVTQTTYDGVGNMITMTAPSLNVTTDSYDSLNRVTQVTDSAGAVSSTTYDPVGNRLTLADGNGNTTTNTYDALNRLVTTTDPLGNTTTSQYDPVGNQTKITDRDGNATTYIYDNINRRISMTDALSDTTQWQYDAVGNLTKLTDANGHVTQYFYDTVNRPHQETYADGFSRSYVYDSVGNLITRTDQLGQVTNYTYNDLYFLTGRTYPSAINDSFTYDLSGRMLSAQRGTWADTFTYDGADRITGTTQNGESISYVYNIPARTRELTYPGGRVITENTDARSRMDHIDDASSPPSIVQYAYDAGDRVLSRTYRNGTSAAYSYDNDDRTVNLQHSHGVTPTAGFSYAYDHEGNKQFENKLQDTTHSEAYQYDNTYRLIDYRVGTLVGSTIPVPSTETSYTLDPVGNWNKKTTGGIPQNRTHNAANELLTIDAQTLAYDADGNILNDGAFTYAHDEENRLTKVTRNADSAVVGQYQYDALSRRVQKIADPAGSPTTTQYFYDDARIIEEQNGVMVTQATYVYGNYVDEVLTMDRGGQTYYYHENALWSEEAVTDSTGTPVERYSYDAYGAVTVTNGTGTPVAPNAWGTPHSAIGNPWTFTARQLDEETGLYDYRARYYDPAKGRFLERDPLENVDGTNLYEYVGDRPTYATDPTGRRTYVSLIGDCRYCRIQVTTYVHFYGEAASAANIRRIKNEIETRWSGFEYWGARAPRACRVNFNVVPVSAALLDAPVVGAFVSGSVDRIELLNGGAADARPSNVSRGAYDENHTGRWLRQNRVSAGRGAGDNFDWTPAHEYGHLIGLPDMYIGGVPEGWAGNIMATDMGRVDNRNIYQFLDAVEKKQGNFQITCPECPPNLIPEKYREMIRRYKEALEQGAREERKAAREAAGLRD